MRLIAIPIALALTGCASTEYAAYAEAQKARASADAFAAFDDARASIDRLRASYDPLFAASKACASAASRACLSDWRRRPRMGWLA